MRDLTGVKLLKIRRARFEGPYTERETDEWIIYDYDNGATFMIQKKVLPKFLLGGMSGESN